mmetsp:Transcript_4186/g.12106  ORF Transcript_4186/g.12106 Transcript_4186/m.12106 type:complete len:144 (-) Transcript_4186:71-502(-)
MPHQIFVKSPQGATTILDVDQTSPVDGVPRGLEHDSFRLISSGRQLLNGRLLSSYNIQKGSTIQVMYRLRVGCSKERFACFPFVMRSWVSKYGWLCFWAWRPRSWGFNYSAWFAPDLCAQPMILRNNAPPSCYLCYPQLSPWR